MVERISHEVGGTHASSTNQGAVARIDPAGGIAFRALLDKLQTQATELEERSRGPLDARELAGELDRAQSSMRDALSISEQLIEAYRAASTRAAAPSEAALADAAQSAAPPNEPARKRAS